MFVMIKGLEVFILYLIYKSSYLTSRSAKGVVQGRGSTVHGILGGHGKHTFKKLPQPLQRELKKYLIKRG